jgi:hypothetical protein
LDSTGSDPEQILVQTTINLTQPFESHPCRRDRIFRKFNRIAVMPVQLTKVVLMQNGKSQFQGVDERGDLDERRLAMDKKPVACECKPPGRVRSFHGGHDTNDKRQSIVNRIMIRG